MPGTATGSSSLLKTSGRVDCGLKEEVNRPDEALDRLMCLTGKARHRAYDFMAGNAVRRPAGLMSDRMSAPVVPVNVQVPADAAAPVVADLTVHAIRMAHAWRRDVERLPVNDWTVPGIYVLLSAGEHPDTYVGKAVDLRARLLQHRLKPRIDWQRAVAIKRDTSHGFNSAEIGYLEGRVASELRSVPGLSVVEGLQTQDETLPPHLLLALDELVPSILAALRLVGVDLFKPEVPDEEQPSPGVRRKHVPKTGSVADLLAAGLLSAGAELHLSQGGTNAQGSVTTAGQILVDGVAYGSPSKAAATALGLSSSNGWTTWHVGDLNGPTLDRLRAQLGVIGPPED
jgi:hypothetical protein